MARVLVVIGLGILIYRQLRFFLFSLFEHQDEMIGFSGLLFHKIFNNTLLPFLIGSLVAYAINNGKNLGWFYGGALIIANSLFVVILDVYLSGFSYLLESIEMMGHSFLYGSTFSLLFAAAGGRYGDLRRRREPVRLKHFINTYNYKILFLIVYITYSLTILHVFITGFIPEAISQKPMASLFYINIIGVLFVTGLTALIMLDALQTKILSSDSIPNKIGMFIGYLLGGLAGLLLNFLLLIGLSMDLSEEFAYLFPGKLIDSKGNFIIFFGYFLLSILIPATIMVVGPKVGAVLGGWLESGAKKTMRLFGRN